MPRPSPIKSAAAARGVTLVQLAEHLGYSAGTVGAVSRGVAAPWPELHRRLKEFFGYDPLVESDVERYVAEGRAAQGLPPRVVDADALAAVGRALRSSP